MLDASLILDAPQLRAERERVTRAILGAAKASIATCTKGLERDLEEVTKAAVKGRLWRAWTSQVFPKGSGIAREPVGTVFVKGGARSQGAVKFFSGRGWIKGSRGQYLAIPTPAAGSRGRRRELTPEEWERRTGAKLRFVPRPGKPGLLVLDQGVLSGRKKVARLNSLRRRATGRGDTTIVIFVLLPMVAFADSFAVEPVVRRWGAKLAGDFVARVKALPDG